MSKFQVLLVSCPLFDSMEGPESLSSSHVAQRIEYVLLIVSFDPDMLIDSKDLHVLSEFLGLDSVT